MGGLTHIWSLEKEYKDAEIKALQEQIKDLQGTMIQAFWQLLRLVNGMPNDPNRSITLADFIALLQKWTPQPSSSASENDPIAARLADLEAAQANQLTLDRSPLAQRIKQRAQDAKERANHA